MEIKKFEQLELRVGKVLLELKAISELINELQSVRDSIKQLKLDEMLI